MLHLLHTSGDPSCCDSQRFLAWPCLAPHLPAAALLAADPAEQARRHDAQQLRPPSRTAISRHQTSPPARGSLLSIGARRPRRPLLRASSIRPPKLKQSRVGYPNLDDSPNYQRTSPRDLPLGVRLASHAFCYEWQYGTQHHAAITAGGRTHGMYSMYCCSK